MQSVKKTSIHATKWSLVEKFAVQGSRFILGIFMARLLLPSDFGILSMLNVFIMVSSAFIDSGLSTALIRQKESSKLDYSTMFCFNILTAVAFYAILFASAPLVSRFFRMDVLTPVLRIISITLIIDAAMSVYVAKMTIALDFRAIALRTMLSSVISGLVGVAMAYCGFGVWALVYQSIVLSVTNLLFVAIYCKWFPGIEFSKDSFHRLFSFGKNMLLVSIMSRIYSNISAIIIGKFYSSKELGFYDRGTNLANFPVANVNGVLSKVTFPILAKIQDETDRLVNVYRKYVSITSVLIFFLSLFVASQAKPIVLLLFGQKWAPSIIFLQIYTFYVMFDHISTINLTLIQVKGRSDLVLKLEIWKKVVSCVFLFSCIPFGVIAICISQVLTMQIALFINAYYTKKLIAIDYKTQIKDFYPYLLASIVACLPSFIISFFDIHHILSITLGILTSLPIYYILMHKTDGWQEVWHTVRDRH